MPGTGLGNCVDGGAEGAVRIANRGGTSPFIIICDHASHWLPESYDGLGLDEADLKRHIGWDPGALPVAERLAEILDAPLVAAGVSRLAIDCNRPLHAADLIPEISETTVIPANAALSTEMRAQRIALSWQPFHDALEQLVQERLEAGQETRLVSVHSFTPVYKGVSRPWEIGVLHDEDERLSAPLLAALEASGEFVVGDNQPYSPTDNVYFTLETHGRSRKLPCVMLEIRNDEIAGQEGQDRWADLLAGLLGSIKIDRHHEAPALSSQPDR